MKNFILPFVFLLLITPTVFSQIPFPQDTIARNDKFNNRMFAAYDSQGKIHLSYTGQIGTDGATREIYYVKEENNGSFSTINLTNNFVDDNYSTLSIDANNKIHIGFTGRDGSNLFQIKYTNNVNGTFSTPIFITTGGLNKATPYSKIGPDSVMHFVYYTFVDGVDNFYYRSYDLRTSVLGPEVLLSNGEAGGDFEAALDVDSNGKVHIVGRAGTLLNSGPLKYFNNVNGNFQEIPTGVVDNINYPRIRIDSNNKIHIVYRANNRLQYINNMSGNFSTPVAISPVGQLPAGIQSLERDNQNRLYITYQSSQTASGRGFYLLFSDNGIFRDTIKIYDITSEYVTRNSSQVITNGQNIAMFYAPGGVRNSQTICDIFMKRGDLFQIIPVELNSFTASVEGNNVSLSWITASEINNSGFEIQRLIEVNDKSSQNWLSIGFVEGKGTSTEMNYYSFTDKGLASGSYKYRIKQIDYNGTFTYYSLPEIIEINSPINFILEQNYPNPFNPITTIKYSIPTSSHREEDVSLKVYDILGNEVATLVNEIQPAGNYELKFDASNLSSGVYLYKLNVGSFVQTKKLILMK